ncbi:mRNA 3' end processing factor [Parahypoxylon ruwenzoriense]
MSNYSESEAIAKDFREALEDLQSNARYEIANLTMIARENTEHALAISGALQEHIKRVAPHKKLPALYLLDSIVKNVGTPYTLFFGRKLYQTFMDAYASVDPGTRRKMDEMLKTWKEPIPGSIDTRPVFPPDVVRPIENALIKARTNALQAQQEQMRSQQQLLGRGRPLAQGMPYRETPTPPGTRSGVHSPQINGYPQASAPGTNGTLYTNPTHPPPVGYPLHHHQPPLPSRSTSTPQPLPGSTAFQPPQLGGYGAPQAGISIDALKDDIQKLITASQAQIAQAPPDPSIQTRLRALMDLQNILQTQNLPQDQLVLVKNQIADLAVTIRAPPAQPSASTHTHTHTPQIPPPVAVASPQPAAAPKISIDSLFGSGALAKLMARGSATPQASAPQPLPATAAIRSPLPRRAEPHKPVITQQQLPPPPADPMALMNMLRKAGLLPGTTPASSSRPASKPMPSLPFPLPFPLPLGTAPINQPHRPLSLEVLTNDIVLRSSSLKQFRPQLLPSLFESLGPQCTQCGRRFLTDEEGKKKKMAHMDWHFRVNQRITEVEKRGQHRSWLVDEVDWIKSREIIDKDYVAPSGDTDAVSGSSASKAPKLQYIPVPDDPRSTSAVCPICQEKFSTVWLDDAQEFVWPDAIKVGERVYHATCHKEATKDGGNTPMYARGTPEPVLGKRKAEVSVHTHFFVETKTPDSQLMHSKQDELTSTRGKLKVEGT